MLGMIVKYHRRIWFVVRCSTPCLAKFLAGESDNVMDQWKWNVLVKSKADLQTTGAWHGLNRPVSVFDQSCDSEQ